jgi:hypothetical protein
MVPVIAEIARPAPFDTPGGHVFFAASQLVGWALLTRLVVGAPTVARTASPRGRRLVLVGCALQILFATIYGATAFDGEPLEASFVVFLLGFVALLVGGLLWASRLRRTEGGGLAAVGLLAVAALGALAMLVGSDPFHDIFLVSSYAAWVVVGKGLDSLPSTLTPRGANRTTPPGGRVESGASGRASQGTTTHEL